MANYTISEDLLIDLYKYFFFEPVGIDKELIEDRIKAQLEDKMERMQRRKEYAEQLHQNRTQKYYLNALRNTDNVSSTIKTGTIQELEEYVSTLNLVHDDDILYLNICDSNGTICRHIKDPHVNVRDKAPRGPAKNRKAPKI